MMFHVESCGITEWEEGIAVNFNRPAGALLSSYIWILFDQHNCVF